MDKKLKAKWVKALMSGKYEQCKGALRFDGAFCCLGVLDEITNGKYLVNNGSVLNQGCGLRKSTQQELPEFNDEGIPFPVIAGFIQENL